MFTKILTQFENFVNHQREKNTLILICGVSEKKKLKLQNNEKKIILHRFSNVKKLQN